MATTLKKYISLFDTKDKYDEFLKSDDFVRPNQSFISDTGDLPRKPVVNPTYYDKTFLNILWSDKAITSYVRQTSHGVEPIGLCVIPKGFLPDGKARFMSLKFMSCETPNTGSTTAKYLFYGDWDTNTGLTQYLNGLIYADNPDQYYGGTVNLASDYWYLADNVFSWDNESSAAVHYYTDAYKPYEFYGINTYICLYDNEGNLNTNPVGYTSGTRGTSEYLIDGGFMSDFDGKENTAAILAVDTVEDYKTSDTLTDSKDSGHFPAAEACWRYCPTGTNQGDWYLGSIGEMSLIVTNVGQITAKLYEINQIYNNEYISSLYGKYMWCSTDYSTTVSSSTGSYEKHPTYVCPGSSYNTYAWASYLSSTNKYTAVALLQI